MMVLITQIKVISSLEKLYDSDKIPERELKNFSVLKNEKKSLGSLRGL